jgi:hypothetical protein
MALTIKQHKEYSDKLIELKRNLRYYTQNGQNAPEPTETVIGLIELITSLLEHIPHNYWP